MKVIAFGTLKGGTGKTTVAFNIGGILAEKHRVLFIDIDPQSNLSDNVGVDIADQSGTTIQDVFDNPRGTKATDVITKHPIEELPNVDIIAGSILLTATELQLVAMAGREYILTRWIERNKDVLSEYDYIIIDTNPSIGIVNQNGFMAADKIILVSNVSNRAVLGAQLFSYHWGVICDNLNIPNNTSALILNNCDRRIGLTKEIIEYYGKDEEFCNLVLSSVIPARADVMNTEVAYLPVNVTAPKSDACEAFRDVVAELKERKVL